MLLNDERLINKAKMSRSDSARKAAHVRWSRRQRDTQAQALFDTPPPITYQTGAKSAMRRLFGRELLPQEVAALACAPKFTNMIASEGRTRQQIKGSLGLSAGYEERSPLDTWGPPTVVWGSSRTIFKNADGDIVVSNNGFSIKGLSKGSGTRALLNQVRTAQQLGVKKIITTAEGRGQRGTKLKPGEEQDLNGFYTWAVLGFNGKIPATAASMLPQTLKSETVQDLMRKPGGKAWWKENGEQFDGEFDLTEGSQSMETLSAYAEAAGAKWR